MNQWIYLNLHVSKYIKRHRRQISFLHDGGKNALVCTRIKLHQKYKLLPDLIYPKHRVGEANDLRCEVWCSKENCASQALLNWYFSQYVGGWCNLVEEKPFFFPKHGLTTQISRAIIWKSFSLKNSLCNQLRALAEQISYRGIYINLFP